MSCTARSEGIETALSCLQVWTLLYQSSSFRPCCPCDLVLHLVSCGRQDDVREKRSMVSDMGNNVLSTRIAFSRYYRFNARQFQPHDHVGSRLDLIKSFTQDFRIYGQHGFMCMCGSARIDSLLGRPFGRSGKPWVGDAFRIGTIACSGAKKLDVRASSPALKSAVARKRLYQEEMGSCLTARSDCANPGCVDQRPFSAARVCNVSTSGGVVSKFRDICMRSLFSHVMLWGQFSSGWNGNELGPSTRSRYVSQHFRERGR